jgi:hypothetical protein
MGSSSFVMALILIIPAVWGTMYIPAITTRDINDLEPTLIRHGYWPCSQ